MRKSLQLSLTAVFAALHAVLYFISFGLWRNWGIYIEAIEGIILGPRIGFLAALFGSSIARMAKPDALWMFGIIAEPLAVFIAGSLARMKWKTVLIAYAVMLSLYFVHPFGRALPTWTILDVLLAFFMIYPAARLSKSLFKPDVKHMSIAIGFISFVCIATDSLIRIFLLVPCGLYNSFFTDFDQLYAMFVAAAVDSYIEDALVMIVSVVVGVPLLASILKLRILERKHSDGKAGYDNS